MPQRTIVVLANSIKHNQHCIAGKCIATKEWIRPVADENGSALSHDQAKCENPYGQFNVKPKQKIALNIRCRVPLPNQPDNYLIDNGRWKQRYTIADHELPSYLDTPSDLWGEGDRILFSSIANNKIIISQSLLLIRTENLRLYLNQYSKRRASFTYNKYSYDLSVTDPNFDNINCGAINICGILCVSLGEVYEGYCFKIIASIF